MAANRTILILEGLPMAHLKAYVPNFPKHMRKRSQSLKLWVLLATASPLQSQVIQNRVRQNSCFEGIFFRQSLF